MVFFVFYKHRWDAWKEPQKFVSLATITNCDNADGDNNEEMTQVMIRSYNLDMMIKMMMMMITMMMIMRE